MKEIEVDRTSQKWLSAEKVLFLTILIDITGYGIVIPLLPFYAARFQASSATLGILISSFSIMQFVFSPLLGRLSDKIGRKPVLLLSIATSLCSFLLFSIANSFLVLLLSRIVAGMATETAVAQAYITDITSESDRAKGLGLLGAAFGVGFIVGPALGGFLSLYGFQAPGLTASILTMINLGFAFSVLPSSQPQHTKEVSDQMSTTDSSYRTILKRPLMGPVLIIVFIVTLAFSMVTVIMPLLGITYFSFESLEMSYVFIYVGVVQVILQGLFIGRLSRVLGDEKLIILGPTMMMLGLFIMPLIPEVTVFFLATTLIAFGVGISNTTIPSFISKRTSELDRGRVLGVNQSIRSIAQVPGPLVGGLMFEQLGLSAPFILGAGVLLLSTILSCRVFQLCALPSTDRSLAS